MGTTGGVSVKVYDNGKTRELVSRDRFTLYAMGGSHSAIYLTVDRYFDSLQARCR